MVDLSRRGDARGGAGVGDDARAESPGTVLRLAHLSMPMSRRLDRARRRDAPPASPWYADVRACDAGKARARHPRTRAPSRAAAAPREHAAAAPLEHANDPEDTREEDAAESRRASAGGTPRAPTPQTCHRGCVARKARNVHRLVAQPPRSAPQSRRTGDTRGLARPVKPANAMLSIASDAASVRARATRCAGGEDEPAGATPRRPWG